MSAEPTTGRSLGLGAGYTGGEFYCCDCCGGIGANADAYFREGIILDRDAWLRDTTPLIPEPSSLLLGAVGGLLILAGRTYVAAGRPE